MWCWALIVAVAGGTLIERLHMEEQVEAFIRNANAVDIESPTLAQKERLLYARDQMVSTFKRCSLTFCWAWPSAR